MKFFKEKNKDNYSDWAEELKKDENRLMEIFSQKEQPMKKPIFENEEECREFYVSLACHLEIKTNHDGYKLTRSGFVEICKKLGYIQQSRLEELKDGYHEFCDDRFYNESQNKLTMNLIRDYIELLENELEKLKNENK